MKCPHCQTEFFEIWSYDSISTNNSTVMKGGAYDGDKIYSYATATTCPKCLGMTIRLTLADNSTTGGIILQSQVYPRGGQFPAAPLEVPRPIAADYAEANEVLPISPKASAALARRCLQAILASQGYVARDLVKQVEAVIGEVDATKAVPIGLRENIDAIRNFGNFSAHPITDQTTFQIVEVEEGEAEWCLQLLLDMFDHYYVSPARAAEKRATLAAKLTGAGKPPMKS